MIPLVIEREPSYLSPSSLGTIEKSPNTFYCQRLVQNPPPREPQSLAAGYGSSFDTQVKLALMKDGIGNKDKIPEILKGVENKDPSMVPMGLKILAEYRKSAYDSHNWVDTERWAKWNYKGIPLFCKLDAEVMYNGKTIPHDWKCSGFASKSGTSPLQKFKIQYDGYQVKGAHKLYRPDIRIEEIDAAWAKQFTTYGWALGYSATDWEEFPVSCDMLTISGTGKIKISTYIAKATVEYQQSLFERYVNAWTSLVDGSFMDRLPNKYDFNVVHTLSKWETWY